MEPESLHMDNIKPDVQRANMDNIKPDVQRANMDNTETSLERDNMAVVVRDAVKSYGKNEPRVLDELSMTVPRGCIYGLLGASGAGKTTLLSAIIGLLKLNSGQIKVLGVTPKEKGGGVPGERIGYMPQDTSLTELLSIKNTFYFFGLVYGMTRREILQRLEFLTKLLDLPDESCRVEDLSGGQKRRLSLAVAVMHNPKLLILDEPTVGQDPTLRQSIWDYMSELCVKENLTIIITTHYIEEARAAHKVGLLRNGKLLAEASPSSLLRQFNCSTLEEVSLLLSRRQTDRDENVQPTYHNETEVAGSSLIPEENTVECIEFNSLASESLTKCDAKLKSTTSSRMKAVIYATYIKFISNYVGLFFTFGFPVVQFMFFILCIGGDPKHLPFGIVNEELGNCQALPGGLANHSFIQLSEYDGCQYTGISCLYIDRLTSEKLKIYYYETLEEGIEATKKGKTLGTIHFHTNFTDAFQRREEDRQNSANSTVEMSQIRVWMDMADYLIARSLQLYFLDNFEKLLEDISKQCNFPRKVTAIPMEINDPVYGLQDQNYKVTMAPGYIITIVMFMTTAFSSTAIISEKLEGVWGRNVAAGLTSTEMLLAHLVANLFVMVVLVTENIVIVFLVFSAYIVGSVATMVALLFVNAVCGIALGIFISVVSSSLYESAFGSTAIMVPYVVVCGIMWPIEGVPYTIRLICSYFPGMTSARAFLNILYKGWGITHPEVYPGFIVPIAWSFIFVVLSVFKLRKYGMG